MKIAVISDSHYDSDSVKAVKKHLNNVDIIIHCGDGSPDIDILAKDFPGEIYAVRGNCDINNLYPIERIIEIMGRRIFITHGHQVDFMNYELCMISKFLVRYFWRFLEGVAGFKAPTSPANNYKKGGVIDDKLEAWAKKNNKFIIFR